jgi:hypothetical protein
VYAAFNRYAELTGTDPRKEIHAYPFNGHEGGEAVQVRRQLDWLRTVVNGPGDVGRGSGWPSRARRPAGEAPRAVTHSGREAPETVNTRAITP